MDVFMDTLPYLRRIYFLLVLVTILSVATAVKVFFFTESVSTFDEFMQCRQMKNTEDLKACFKDLRARRVYIPAQ